MLSVVPALATVGVTVVPSSALPNVEMRCTWCASSRSALIPFSGSNPACEARPVMRTSNVPVPLRAIFNAPPSALGSSTSTAPFLPSACARSSMSARLVEEPISSSAVHNISIPEVSTPELSRIAIAYIACTIPAAISNTPGPRNALPSLLKGLAARVPIGCTVSW